MLRQVEKQLVKRVANDTLAREHLQLMRIADDSMNEMKRPPDTGPKMRPQLYFVGGAKFGFDPIVSVSLDLLECTLSHIAAPASGISDWLTRDVADGPKAHRNLDMPTDHTIGLRTHGKQVHFAETVL